MPLRKSSLVKLEVLDDRTERQRGNKRESPNEQHDPRKQAYK